MKIYGKKKTALFIGHRDCFGINRNVLEAVIENEIKNGIVYFLSGGQGDFDRISASAVYALKEKYPHIKNYLVMPYQNFNVFDREIFDEIFYPMSLNGVPYKAAIPRRNRYMVNNASTAICYIMHTMGGAGDTFFYAENKKLKIINIYKKYNGTVMNCSLRYNKKDREISLSFF